MYVEFSGCDAFIWRESFSAPSVEYTGVYALRDSFHDFGNVADWWFGCYAWEYGAMAADELLAENQGCDSSDVHIRDWCFGQPGRETDLHLRPSR